MALDRFFRNSTAGRVLADAASASLDTLRQTTKSSPGSGIPPAMALASAALLGIVSTFSWSNVLSAGKYKELMEQKHERQERERTQEDPQEASQWDLSGSGATEVAAVARKEFEGLIKPS